MVLEKKIGKKYKVTGGVTQLGILGCNLKNWNDNFISKNPTKMIQRAFAPLRTRRGAAASYVLLFFYVLHLFLLFYFSSIVTYYKHLDLNGNKELKSLLFPVYLHFAQYFAH